MEYPNVTVIAEAGSASLLDNVIAHETGHNWFYGILGFNERRYPFLDEGINSFYELRYMDTRYPDRSMADDIVSSPFLQKWLNFHHFAHRDINHFAYLSAARSNTDQPMTIPADEYTSANYGNIVYMKTAISVETLRAHLGDSIFDKGMKTFFERWKFKHPGPDDWRQVMEEVSGQDLSWYYGRLINSTDKADLKVKKIKKDGDNVQLTVKNTGKLTTPVLVTTRSNGEDLNTYQFGLLAQGEKNTFTLKKDGATEYRIDGERSILDINRRNNTIKDRGLFKKMEPLQLRLLTSTENPQKTQLFVTPLVGWNTSDQFMLGLGVHNKSFTEKPFEFFLGPMYSFKREELTGITDLSYHFYFPQFVRRMTVNFNWMRFSYDHPYAGNPTVFNRYYPKVSFQFKPKNANSPIYHDLQLGAIIVEEDIIREGAPNVEQDKTYATIRYRIGRRTALHSLGFTAYSLTDEDISMLSGTLRYSYRYNERRNRVSVKLFGGTSLYNNTNNPRYNWRMDGQSGWHDFTFSQVFLDRGQTHDVWSQQMNDNMGGFKTPTSVGQSKYWLLAANVKLEAPIVVPIGGYVDLGTSGSEDFMASGGLYFRVIRDAMEVYFPLFWSQNILDEYDAIDRPYAERIRFTLNLPAVNPYRIIQQLF
ncbi:hypothetical protein KFE98_10940 [bacterium SCSIO 12741]|nr:hypothetical protein KFE98_10940 [bacterium SCSIO 12741]